MIATTPFDLKVESLRLALCRLDPHATIEMDAGNRHLRVRSLLSSDDVRQIAGEVGLRLGEGVARLDIAQRGSECCGGCSG